MIDELQQKAQQLFKENAPVILTAGGVVGTVATAVLTGRAVWKTSEVFNERKMSPLVSAQDDPNSPGGVVTVEEVWEDISTAEKAKWVWHLYIPPVTIGGATLASIIMANQMSAKKAAALAAAYGISERTLQEYREKALEKLGINKEQKLRDEIAQDQVSNNPNHQIVMVGDGEVLFYDNLTGRYFKSTVERIHRALADVHGEIYKYNYASLTQFFDELGLRPTDYTEIVGWNIDNIPEIEFSTTTTPDDRPCMVLSFINPPKPEYTQIHS